jgi:hypothetical protein
MDASSLPLGKRSHRSRPNKATVPSPHPDAGSGPFPQRGEAGRGAWVTAVIGVDSDREGHQGHPQVPVFRAGAGAGGLASGGKNRSGYTTLVSAPPRGSAGNRMAFTFAARHTSASSLCNVEFETKMLWVPPMALMAKRTVAVPSSAGDSRTAMQDSSLRAAPCIPRSTSTWLRGPRTSNTSGPTLEKKNGYLTLTRPPPLGGGKRRLRRIPMTQSATDGSPKVVSSARMLVTVPSPAMTQVRMMRPARFGSLESSAS